MYHTQKGIERKNGLSFPQFQKSKERMKMSEKIPTHIQRIPFLEIEENFIKEE